jgi:PAS domain S-box-containing protein
MDATPTARVEIQEAAHLRSTLARQAALLASVPDIIMEVDANKIYTWANESGMRFFGDDVVGRAASYYFEGAQDTYDVVLPLFQGDEHTVYVESWQRRRDGECRLLTWWCRVLKDEAGHVTGALSTARDVTAERQATAELREAEERFRSFFDNAPIGKSMTAPDGRLMRVNPAFAAMLGYSVEEMQKVSFAAITHPDDVAESRECMRALLADECAKWAMEKRYIAKDGRVVWTSVTTALQRGRDGEPLYLVTHVQDITDRKRAEETLVASALRFRSIIESLTDVVYDWDLEDQITWYGNIDGVMGYPSGEFPRTMAGWAARLHPEDAGKVMVAVDRQLAGDVPYDVVYRIKNRNDEWRCWSARGKALRDAAGKPYRWIGSITDITDRRRGEEELTQSERKYRTLHETMMDGFVRVGIDGSITECNEVYRAMLGYSESELKRLTYVDLTPERWHAFEAKVVEQIVARGHSDVYEKEYRRKDGTVFPVELRTVLTRDENGNPSGMWAVTRDITERKRAEEEVHRLNAELDQRVTDRTAQLEAANHELEAFSYSVSHDLRAPLRAIDGYGRILAEDYEDRLDPEGRRLLGVMSSETRRMGQLIDDLLAFSRLGRQQMEPSVIDMTALAGAVFEDQAARAPERELQLDLAQLLPAHGDRAMIRVLLDNLLSNAIKFTTPRRPAAIDIGSRQEDGQTVYWVKDNGVGFDMAYAHKLFGVFQRLHSSEDFEGTGVGLALAQRIVHRHGGRVWATGRVNEGAAFYFSLPSVEAQG